MSTKKEKIIKTSPKTKIIKTPGSLNERVAQACDRCRLKKTKCDGKRPQCSQCASVGFECKISDKLSRRAFPRGYTETLEERVREIEAENKRLIALLDLKNAKLEHFTNFTSDVKPLSSSNLSILNKLQQDSINHEPTHIDSPHVHTGPGCCANYPHSVNERPVSIAGSVDLDNGDITDDDESLLSATNKTFTHNYNNFLTNISFEQNQAPGLNAALAISKMNDKKVQLANLVSMSIPRSTEETLFIPSLLSKIGEIHGYNSIAILSTALTIASLKEYPKITKFDENINLSNLNFRNITSSESNLFFNSLKLPSKILLDQLITLFFQDWNSFLPIIDKNEFLNQYLEFSKSMELKFLDNLMFNKEKFGLTLILILQLGILSFKFNNIIDEELQNLIKYYDNLIHELILNSYIVSNCSIQSLQILSLSLLYCLNIGDVITSYTLRGKIISMAQQLRLHRCPSAVLGSNGSIVSQHQQAERRILFWCIYSLDVFASLQLGVPRLLKDYEIESALPFANENDDLPNNEDSNILIVDDSEIKLVGKVSNFSLSIMRYSKILGNVLDNIFKRQNSKHESGESLTDLIFIHENLLDNWRRNLPSFLKFEIDVNGSINYNVSNNDLKKNLLSLLYFNVKFLIHLPLISNEINDYQRQKFSQSYISIQQSINSMLKILSNFHVNGFYLSIPINVIRFKIRLALIMGKNSLDYTRGGSIFQDYKKILSTVTNELKFENSNSLENFPGNVSLRCLKLFEKSIENLLSPPSSDIALKKLRKPSISSSSGSSSIQRPRGQSVSSPLSYKTNNGSNNNNNNTIKKESGDDELSQMLSQLDNVPPILANNSINNQRVPIPTKQRSQSLSIKNPSPTSQQINFGNGSTSSSSSLSNSFQNSDQSIDESIDDAYGNGNGNVNGNLNGNVNGSSIDNNNTTTIHHGDTDVKNFKFNEIDLDILNNEQFDNVELDFGVDGSLGLATWLNFENGGENNHLKPFDETKQDTGSNASSLFDWQHNV